MKRLSATLLLFTLSGLAQRTRTPKTPSNPTATTGAYNEPAATMHGILKKLNGKTLVIVTDGDQSVEIVRTHKTKFLQNGKEIKPSEIALGSVVSVDVGKFPDLTPQAVNVMVDSPPVEGAVATPAKSADHQDQMDQEQPAEASPDPTPAKSAAPPSR